MHAGMFNIHKNWLLLL